jgi:hypothetical protein
MKYAVISFGSFCDIKLSNIVVKRLLEKGHKVVYITPPLGSQGFKHVNMDLQEYILPDISEDESLIKTNPEKIIIPPLKIISYAIKMRAELPKMFNRSLVDIDHIVVHYPALAIVSVMPRDIIKNTKTSIFFVAPGHPNHTIPWLTSGDEMDNYNPKNTKKYTSSNSFYKGLSRLNLFGKSIDVLNFIKNSAIYAMWDKVVVGLPKSNLKVKQLGALTDISFPRVPFNKDIAKILKSKRKKAYFSLGSQKINTYLGYSIPKIIKTLLDNGFDVIYHSKVVPGIIELSKVFKDRLLVYSSFVKHEQLIPKIDIVVTSGSICMVNVANYHGVKCIYTPIIPEQLYWAKVYKQKTGQDYIYEEPTKENGKISQIIDYCLTSSKVNKYIERLKKSMRSKDATQQLVNSLTK